MKNILHLFNNLYLLLSATLPENDRNDMWKSETVLQRHLCRDQFPIENVTMLVDNSFVYIIDGTHYKGDSTN